MVAKNYDTESAVRNPEKIFRPFPKSQNCLYLSCKKVARRRPVAGGWGSSWKCECGDDTPCYRLTGRLVQKQDLRLNAPSSSLLYS